MSNSSLTRDDSERYHENNLHIKKRLVYLNGEIDGYSANEFIKNFNILDNISDDPITIHINSCGGEVDSGWGMYDRIRQSQCFVEGQIYGECSSMATIILQACDRRLASEHSIFLFHEGTAGKDDDHSRNLEIFAKLIPIEREKMYKVYSEATGLKTAKLEKLFTFDKYLTVQLAFKMGFVDQILENEPPIWLKEKNEKGKKKASLLKRRKQKK